MFRTVPLSIIRSFHCTHSNDICHTGLLTACEEDQDGTSWSCSQAVRNPVWHIPFLCVQWKTSDDGQRNCPKHVKFYSKNKFEKLVHLVGFVIRIYHDARSPERQINLLTSVNNATCRHPESTSVLNTLSTNIISIYRYKYSEVILTCWILLWGSEGWGK